MADPGVSGQNFLRLLFGGINGRGGAQAGVDQIPQQQAQQADLTLALQRMMQQKQQFDESTAGIDRRFNTEQDRLKAAEAARLQHQQSVEGRQGQEAFFNTHQNWIERQNQQAFRAKLIEQYPHLGPAFGVLGAGGTAGMANSMTPDAAVDPNVDPTTDPQRLSFWRAVDSRLGRSQIYPPNHEDGVDSIEEYETAKLDAAIELARESGWKFMLGGLLQKRANNETALRGVEVRERFESNPDIPAATGPTMSGPQGPTRAKKGPTRAKKQSSTSSGNLNPVEQKIAQLYEDLGINA